MTDPGSASFRSPGIVTSAGPGGATAFRIGVNDDDRIELKDTECLRLGKDGTDFTVSMWLKLSAGTRGTSEIFGSKDRYDRSPPGFSLYSQQRADGQMELALLVSPLPSRAAQPVKGAITVVTDPIKVGEWVHVALIYDSSGPGTAATLGVSVNLARFTGEAPPNLYLPRLWVGDQGWNRSDEFEVSEMRSYRRVLTDSELKAVVLQNSTATAGLSVTELQLALNRLRAHADGVSVLAADALDAEVARLQRHGPLMDTDINTTRSALNLVTAYEDRSGALFVTPETSRGIKSSATGSDPMREPLAMAKVHQAVMDHAFTASNAQNCSAELDGKRWQTSDYFPGRVASEPIPNAEHRPTIDATVPAVWGRPVAFSTQPAVRPTGLYLSAGGVAEVTVPDSMVGSGFELMVGAHTKDFSDKELWNRLPRVTKRYPITAKTTRIASPLGGSVIVMVPYLAALGQQTITIKGGVVEAPYFSARRFDKTTDEQWRTRRTAPGLWAVFESDKFMMTVPSDWINKFEGPTALMQKWDTAMDGFVELLGFPIDKRNRTVLYTHVDTQIIHATYGIGYPSGNQTDNPATKSDGNRDHWFLRDPLGWFIEYHELGHANQPTQFRGETEALVHLPLAYIKNVKFSMDFDTAFAESAAHPGPGRGGLTPDQAAVDWMVTPNFRNGAEMNYSNTTKDEFRYQHRGFAKYADVARTFGWDAITGFFRQEHLDHMAGTPSDGLSAVDSRILRMSVAANADLTPLIHFWGVHPVDAVALKSAMTAKRIPSSPKVRALLERYVSLIPMDNASFNAALSPRYPFGCQFPDPDYGCGWFEVWKTKYGTAEGAQAKAALQALIQRYYP